MWQLQQRHSGKVSTYTFYISPEGAPIKMHSVGDDLFEGEPAGCSCLPAARAVGCMTTVHMVLLVGLKVGLSSAGIAQLCVMRAWLS
jgi:hypothetical protein